MERKGPNHKFFNEIEWFDSYDEALDVAQHHRVNNRSSTFNNDWSGNIFNWDHARRMTLTGWREGGERLKPSFDAAAMANINTHGEEMRLDMAGFTPCVPSYLAGDPMHMRRRVEVNSTKAPIRVIVDISSSGGVEAAAIEARSTAIACLVFYLSIFRAVDLYIMAGLSGTASMHSGFYIPVVKLGTTPIDLSALAWRMCHPWSARGLLYGLGNYQSGMIGWAHFNGRSAIEMNAGQFQDKIREVLALDMEDVVFPAIKYKERFDDPQQWAKDRMREMGYDLDS
jgi:hypothetical protein